MMLLEIFVNYDCDISQKDITERIIDSLSKIANGRFLKTEHQNMISNQEEYQLRSLATKILVSMLRSFDNTIDAQVTEQRLTTHMQTSKGSLSLTEQGSILETDPTDTTNRSIEEDIKKVVSVSDAAKVAKNNKFEELQSQRNVKNEMQKAAMKFNFKPKNGITFLVKNNLVCSPETDRLQHTKDLVKFLKTTPTLNKTIIGEYLGADADQNKACLYEFIDQYELKNVPFVSALKIILSGFRLPGEGQVVDRIMEKFGEKYASDNPNGGDEEQGTMS